MANSAPVPDVSLQAAQLAEQLGEAEHFLSTEELTGIATADRVLAVLAQIRATGRYWHSERELEWGARLAWRHAITCVGRASWRSLVVRDRREAATPDQVAEACIEHLATATNGGRVRLMMTVLAPESTSGRDVRIVSPQLIQYAGYRQANGRVVGDPKNIALTELAVSVGWRGTGGRFDILPLIVQAGSDTPRWYPLPARVVREVPISHPDHSWLGGLGLRWYAHPAISDLRLRVGGIDYPAAPFSAWYTLPEVSARNLSDQGRYDSLPVIAERMGLDTSTNRTLWRDEALLVLSQAVLHSYREHGVTLVDHHTVCAAFAYHEQREHQAGREVFGDWRSLVPAMAPSTTPLYRRAYTPTVMLPNFFPAGSPTGSRRGDEGGMR
jgi:nitric-oxide synthase, bacterial